MVTICRLRASANTLGLLTEWDAEDGINGIDRKPSGFTCTY